MGSSSALPPTVQYKSFNISLQQTFLKPHFSDVSSSFIFTLISEKVSGYRQSDCCDSASSIANLVPCGARRAYWKIFCFSQFSSPLEISGEANERLVYTPSAARLGGQSLSLKED